MIIIIDIILAKFVENNFVLINILHFGNAIIQLIMSQKNQQENQIMLSNLVLFLEKKKKSI